MGLGFKPADRDELEVNHARKLLMRKKSRDEKDDTRLVHAGREPSRFHGFVNTPIYRGSTILFPTVAALEANDQAFTYGRLGTPTVRALEEAIAELEGGHATLLTPSGLSAIATTLLAFLAAGDHLLVTDAVYRPTRRFCDGLLKRLGVTTTYYDPLVGAGIAKLMQKNTRVVFANRPARRLSRCKTFPPWPKPRMRKVRCSCWTILGRRRFISNRFCMARMSQSRPRRNISAATPM